MPFKVIAASLLLLSSLRIQAQPHPQAPPRIQGQLHKPKILVAIVVDQFRYDYLTRFRSQYTGGIAQLLAKGAVFTNANYEHFPTVTAVGHSTYLSGASPAVSGIIANEWVDRAKGVELSSVDDKDTLQLGGNPKVTGASPRKLLVSTIADELKMVYGHKSTVVGISIKDRSAILPVGAMADGAFWFDGASGHFVSSDYYYRSKQLPDWASRFNDGPGARKYLGKSWSGLDSQGTIRVFRRIGETPNKSSFDDLERTPFGNDLVEDFAEAAITGEEMGSHQGVDVLAVSFSSNDRVGHIVGPDADEIPDISRETDRAIGKLLSFAAARAGGPQNLLVVFTSDHGVAPVPEESLKKHLPAGRVSSTALARTLQEVLSAKFGEGDWIQGRLQSTIYLNHDLAAKQDKSLREIQDAAAEILRATPLVFRVYTASDLEAGRVPGDRVDQRIRNSYNAASGADLYLVLNPYCLFEGTGTDHGSPFSYDTHVPVIFMGAGVKPGVYNQTIAVNDIAPTLATLLAVETPSGSTGRALQEMIAP